MEAFLIGGPMEAYATAAAFDMFQNSHRYSYEEDGRSQRSRDLDSNCTSTSSTSRPLMAAHKCLLGWLRKYICCFQPEVAPESADVTVELSVTSPQKLNP